MSEETKTETKAEIKNKGTNGWKLFKDVVEENPVDFKQHFSDALKGKIVDKIKTKEQEIVNNINTPKPETPTEPPKDNN